MVEKLKRIDRKILAMLIFLIVIIIIFVIAMVLMSMMGNAKTSYSTIEKTMVKAAKKYYGDNPSLLPKTSGKDVEIDASVLVSGGYMKEISEYTKGTDCSGKVLVGKTKTDYDYAAYLDCGDKYTTPLFYKMLINKKVTSGDGLYAMEDFITSEVNLDVDEDGYDLSSNELLHGYVFRGQTVDNYIQLGNLLYRIVKIDGNNDFTVVLATSSRSSYFDNRYNSETEKNDGVNEYKISMIYDYGKTFYRDKLKADNLIKTKGVPKNVCIGARSTDETVNDGSIECSKVLKDTYVSLLPVYDIMNASLSTECTSTLDPNCGNYNYLMKDSNYWTLTPSDEDSFQVYRTTGRKLMLDLSRNSAGYKYVYFLTNKLIYVSGSGTQKDPYIVK